MMPFKHFRPLMSALPAAMFLLATAWLPLSAALGSPLGEPGWRFRSGSESHHLTWPLPSSSPLGPGAAARPHPADPSTWGTLTLAGSAELDREVQIGGAKLSALPSDARPVLDGQLGAGEWAQARQIVCPFGVGEALVVLAQYDDYFLYLCLAVPSRPGRVGQHAELCFEIPRRSATQLGAEHLCLRLVATGKGVARQLTLAGSAGAFQPAPASFPVTWRGGAGGRGDGAWGYAVFEFAVPFDYLGARQDALGLPLGFLARVQGSGGKSLSPLAPTETLWWPNERSSAGHVLQTPLSLRPDFWGRLKWETTTAGEGLLAPQTNTQLSLDGELSDAEWGRAARSLYVLPGNQWRLLMAQRDDQNLQLGVAVNLARGERRSETCTLYFDPRGDGGLRPRPDDLAFRLQPDGSEKLTLLRYVQGRWTPSGESLARGVGVAISSHESAYELTIPLQLLPDLAATPRLAVEVSYEPTVR